MVLCLKSEQCSPVVARLSPVCAATSVAFLFYNIAFVCFLYSAEQPLWMGQKKLLYSSLVCTSFKAEFLTTTLFCWTEIKKKRILIGRLAYVSKCPMNHYTPIVKIPVWCKLSMNIDSHHWLLTKCMWTSRWRVFYKHDGKLTQLYNSSGLHQDPIQHSYSVFCRNFMQEVCPDIHMPLTLIM